MKFEVPVAETANCPPSLHSGERGVKREGTKNVDLTSQLDKICPCALGQFNKFNFLSFYGGGGDDIQDLLFFIFTTECLGLH